MGVGMLWTRVCLLRLVEVSNCECEGGLSWVWVLRVGGLVEVG